MTILSIGNNWLKVVNLGRFALSLYNKFTGAGCRVFIDPEKLSQWPMIKSWLLKLEPKKDQDTEALFSEIKEAGHSICSYRSIQVHSRFLTKSPSGKIGLCPICQEYYPLNHGPVCRGCLGDEPYTSSIRMSKAPYQKPSIKAVSLDQAVGKKALHDMTRIVPGQSKRAEILAGQTISDGDLCRLQLMGESRVYVQDTDQVEGFVHENEAALAFAEYMAGPGISFSSQPREGKINFFPEQDGLLVVNSSLLSVKPVMLCYTLGITEHT